MGRTDKRRSTNTESGSRRKKNKATQRQYVPETSPSQLQYHDQTQPNNRVSQYDYWKYPGSQPRDTIDDDLSDPYVDNDNSGDSDSDSITEITRVERFNHTDEVSYSSTLSNSS